jgi:excisionase family DNA binding protein
MVLSKTASRLRTLPETAERLGVSVKCLRGWIYQRRIPYVKVGRRAVRVSEETIDQIIARGTVPALHKH